MASSRRRPRLRRTDFGSSEEYARALWEAGPQYEDLAVLVTLPGEYGARARAVFGESLDDFGQACEAELSEEARARPHVFVRKLTRVRPPQ